MKSTSPPDPVKVVIVGAGPVGSLLALLLARNTATRNSFLLVDRAPAGHSDDDPRAIALAAGSLQLLSTLIELDALPGGAIRRIHVSQRGHLGRTEIRAEDERVQRLGLVVRYGALMRLIDAALELHGVQVLRPASRTSIDLAQFETSLTDLRPAAWVHAEGGAFNPDAGATSATQATTLVAEQRRDYAQTAIICELQAQNLPAGVAWERFCEHGPLALLPLPETGRLAMVWCERADTAKQLAALDDADFLRRLQDRFGMRAGRFLSATPRHTFALGLVRRNETDGGPQSNSVRIGNAAQTLHPVAGQGMNLGFRDAHVLARLLGPALENEASLEPVLAAFRQARVRDRRATIGVTDFLARSFALPEWASPVRHLAGIGLIAMDAAPGLRSALAHRLMFGVRN